MISRRGMLKSSAAILALAVPTAAHAQDQSESISSEAGVGPIDYWESTGGPSLDRSDVSISVKDSPLPNALDWYYSFLLGIAEQNGYTDKQKLLVNNVITPFDIAQDTPYYNEGLFRSFADRVYTKSPQEVGPANKADRFSLHYGGVIHVAAAGIDRKYKETVAEIEGLQARLGVQTEKLSDRILKINSEWRRVATGSGLKDDDPEYELRYLNYLESIRYADQVSQYSQNIDMITGTIDAVRRSKYTPEEQLLLDNITQLSETFKVARPLRPTFERTVKGVNDLTFANPTVRVSGLMDIAPAMYPLGDLVRFLQVPGAHGDSVQKDTVSKHKHDESWSAGGSVSYSFFSVGGSGSGSSSYRQDISKSKGIAVNFENISEYLIDRQLWFNPAVFHNDKLKPILAKIPGTERLQFVSVSLIIGRGLTLQLTFNESITTESWSKRSFAASGGVSFMGFGFGASGGNSSYDYTLEVSGDGRTVTFKDDPQLTRVLAVRLEPFVEVESGLIEAPSDLDMAAPNTPLAKFLKGEIGYSELQESKF
ncbi:hypothetical protein [Mesorhizobium sp. B2-5-3]|uniref:hypothetical protein n=1 Tax=Mesorhizobium sp. B2-5-3 TaxID=2589927 RepID=UPI00112979FB|nr:hypothetical protein [Mesorhizobium sp. B2-5-3]TPK36358.1 hypothetical protein FJ867_14930 [Mesorhizobium sp. B2-5-3]